MGCEAVGKTIPEALDLIRIWAAGGGPSVLERFTAVIWGNNRQKFTSAPEDAYLNQTICVTGVIAAYEEDGSAQIEVSKPSQIVVVQ